MKQLGLPLPDGQNLRDASVQQVQENAAPEWLEEAVEAVFAVAVMLDYFTADDVWEALQGSESSTHEPRALGAVMVKASKLGYISPTDLYRQSRRRVCHARPMRVWKSLLI